MSKEDSNSKHLNPKAKEILASRTKLDLATLKSGLLNGDRMILAKAITMAESTHPQDQALAMQLMSEIAEKEDSSLRIAISGAPGVGKSTFIEALGNFLTGKKIKTAILSIDPTSTIHQGSILGDKTRMEQLAKNPLAFIRPSPNARHLGGVNQASFEAILLCEKASYEVILIETVGVGQSEIEVKNMSDIFCLLVAPGSGDDLQGIKKGIMEMSDIILINKTDGDRTSLSKQTKNDLVSSLKILSKQHAWTPPVLPISSTENKGIDVFWEAVKKFEDQQIKNGQKLENRKEQYEKLYENKLMQKLLFHLMNSAKVQEEIKKQKAAIKQGLEQPLSAVAKSIKTINL